MKLGNKFKSISYEVNELSNNSSFSNNDNSKTLWKRNRLFNNKNLCGVILYLNSIDVITIPIKIYETIIGRYSLDIIASNIYTKCELFDKNPNYQSYIDDGIKKTYEYIKKRGTRPFDYNINIEINNDLTPTTWKNKEI